MPVIISFLLPLHNKCILSLYWCSAYLISNTLIYASDLDSTSGMEWTVPHLLQKLSNYVWLDLYGRK